MTISEIYAKIVQHQIKGLMVHEQMAEYFDFLSLKGYEKCQDCHYYKESKSFRHTVRHFINFHNTLVPALEVDNPEVIPSSWYKYTRDDVDITTKKNAVKNAFEVWRTWEKDTKKLYETLYKECMALNEICAALYIETLVEDVSKELKYVEQECLRLKAIDYDLSVIIPEQETLYEQYKQKIAELD